MPRANLSEALSQINRLFGEGTLAGLTDAQLLNRHASHGDELAFKALVQRHGPMVLAVCRGILSDSNDADDAFQAVFLLLARKARSLWINDSLGGWLHRVSCRIAFQVKADAARRRDRERRAAEFVVSTRAVGPPWDDTQAVVHEEIDRLPQRYREPIVLCYLEQMTYQQAARQLCWSEATTQGRLARGRNLLRTRLTRRGVTVGAALLASTAAPQAASAVSLAFFEAALRSVRQFALGEVARTGVVSSSVSAIVSKVVRSMMIAKLANIGAAALVVGSVSMIVVTNLPATGRTIENDQPRPRSADAQANFGPTSFRVANDTTAKGRSTSKLLPGLRGRVLELRRDHQRQNAFRANASKIGRADGRVSTNFTMDLKPGQRLNCGDSLFSALGGFRLTLTEDGDLALYAIDDTQLNGELRAGHRPELMKLYTNLIWSAGTHVASGGAGPGSHCVMHADGNFVVYDQADQICLESGTRGYPGSFLRCQDDGNLVIYTPDLKAIWSSGTVARGRERDEPGDLEDTTTGDILPTRPDDERLHRAVRSVTENPLRSTTG